MSAPVRRSGSGTRGDPWQNSHGRVLGRRRGHQQRRARWSWRRLGSFPSETVASVCPQRWAQGYLLMRRRGLRAQPWAELFTAVFLVCSTSALSSMNNSGNLSSLAHFSAGSGPFSPESRRSQDKVCENSPVRHAPEAYPSR